MNAATKQLTADELAVCNATGLDAAAFLAAQTEPAKPVLTADELAVCNATGLDPALLIATRNSNQAPR